MQSRVKRIVVVEDHDDVARVVALLLAGEGHTVEVAPTASRALAAISTFDPHVVVIDIVLPDGHGDHLAERLRGSHPQLRLVGMTGAAKLAIDRRELFHAWLAKPFTLEQLSIAIGE